MTTMCNIEEIQISYKFSRQILRKIILCVLRVTVIYCIGEYLFIPKKI